MTLRHPLKRSAPLLIPLAITGVLAMFLGPAADRPGEPACTEIAKADSLVAAPGKYCLAADIGIDDNTGIIIQGQDIDLDLRGHCIRGNADPMTRGIGVDILAGSARISITNGCISGLFYGLRSDEGTEQIDVSDLRLHANRFRGAYLAGNHVSVRHLQVSDTGGSRVYDDAYSIGIEVFAKNCLIADNSVTETYPTDCGEGVGISQSSNEINDCRIERNRITNSRFPEGGRTFGIWAKNNNTVILSNTIEATSYSIVAGSMSLVKGNTLVDETCRSLNSSSGIDYGMNTSITRRSLQCPDVLDYARTRFSPADRCSAFRLAQIHQMKRNYPEAAKYYFIAGGEEALRQTGLFLDLGLATKREIEKAEVDAKKLLARSRKTG